LISVEAKGYNPIHTWERIKKKEKDEVLYTKGSLISFSEVT